MANVKSIGRPWIHEGIRCDDCFVNPILGLRCKCKTCPDHDLCGKCHAKKERAGGVTTCEFLMVEVDSSRFYPPFQVRYYRCNSCNDCPIQGRRYRHHVIPDYDLCSSCFEEGVEPAGNFHVMEETKVNTLCQSHSPVYHFHRECKQCGQLPICGPRFDYIKPILTGVAGEDYSLCLTCFDSKFTNKTIESSDFERVERPEVDYVIHIDVRCCFQCGEAPICGPAFFNTRVAEECLCLICYQNIDPSRWQFEYRRVDPPGQYGAPPSTITLSVREALQLRKEYDDLQQEHEDLKEHYNVILRASGNANSSNANGLGQNNSSSQQKDEDINKLSRRLDSAIMQDKPNVKWDDVAGLESAKQALQEAVVLPVKFPQFFEGDRKPWNAFLLYGPPGTGKSYLAKAVATEVSSTFFSISASDVRSKWHGESENLVSQLFEKARKAAPSVIFIDEIDSIAGVRKESDETAVMQEILVQMQGVGNNNDKVLVLAATNLPYNLDQGIRRRFDKRIYIPLPDQSARKEMFKIHLNKTPHFLTDADFQDLATRTPGFSGSDISVCVKDALWVPLRKVQAAQFFKLEQNFWYMCKPHEHGAVKTTMQELEKKKLASKVKLPPIARADFDETLAKQRPTVSQKDLKLHEKFTKEFGEGGIASEGNDCELDDDLSKLNSRLDSAVIQEKPNVKWDDVAGLAGAKQALQEAVVFPIKFPQLFQGDRKPWNAFLLYGPPGTGKSYLAKAVATEVNSTFFSISAADLGSKWIGESEMLVSQLFEKARKAAPSIIFIDEIDSIAGSRKETDITAVKTEILVQMQGVGNNNDKVLVLAATNLPYSLDQAIRRRFDKRIYIPLPDHSARKQMFQIHLKKTPHSLTDVDFEDLAARTPGFSGSDISVCVKDVLWVPLRKVQGAKFFRVYQDFWYMCEPHEQGAMNITMQELERKDLGPKIVFPPIARADFEKTLAKQRPTVSKEDLKLHEKFTAEFGEEGTDTGAENAIPHEGFAHGGALHGSLLQAVQEGFPHGGVLNGGAGIVKLGDGPNLPPGQDRPNVKWMDVAGLDSVKNALREAVILPIKHPQFFDMNRKPWMSYLLFGPRGTGKSYLAQAVGTEVESFFSISGHNLASGWHAEGEKLVDSLFQKARQSAPSIVFIDDIDVICGQQIPNGFNLDGRNLVLTAVITQLQVLRNNKEKVLILGATNVPYNLDPSLRNCFEKRISVTLPEQPARKEMFKLHLGQSPHCLTEQDFEEFSWRANQFSGADISACVRNALVAPRQRLERAWFFKQVYDLDHRQIWTPCSEHEPGAYATTYSDLVFKGWGDKIQPQLVTKPDFDEALSMYSPTVSQLDMDFHIRFSHEFGEEG